MTPEQRQRLLALYATGGLSEAERHMLFEAALHDQALFNELAEEEPLRDLLSDPAIRGEILAALDEPGTSSLGDEFAPAIPAPAQSAAAAFQAATVRERSMEPWYRRRWLWMTVAAPAFGVLLLSISLFWLRPPQPIEPPATVATVRPPEPPPVRVERAAVPIKTPAALPSPKASALASDTAPIKTLEADKPATFRDEPEQPKAAPSAQVIPEPAAKTEVAEQKQTLAKESAARAAVGGLAAPSAPAQQAFSQKAQALPPQQAQSTDGVLGARPQRQNEARTDSMIAQIPAAANQALAKKSRNAPPATLAVKRKDDTGDWQTIFSGGTIDAGVPVRLILNVPTGVAERLVKVSADGSYEPVREKLDMKGASTLTIDLGPLTPGAYRYRLDPSGAEIFFTVR